ncbi:serine/threonine-protein kinase [Singulisphaera sp. Ch08]|uniref:Serine/threonine-protein kinase n=1 Tax=Singulisphaera sp. Ch08 TaxID=3120278 RepID=A0AAU7C8A5_9BACT
MNEENTPGLSNPEEQNLDLSYSDEPECLEAINALPTLNEAWLVPDEVGAYRLSERLGEGGYGIVFRGQHRITGRHAAIKLEHLPRLKPGLLTQFLTHARIAASIKPHAHLVLLHDAGFDPDAGLAYLVMELVEGPNLREWIRNRSGPVPPRVAARIALGVTEALVVLGNSGIAHRDLKPSNILLDPGDPNDPDGFPYIPRVADYGLARRDSDEGEGTRTVSMSPSGTTAYIPPERFKNPECDPKPGDLYALGVILYELATGFRPFQGSSDFETQRLVVAGNFIDPRRHVPSLPRGLERIILNTITRDPGDRYLSPTELRDDLKRFLEGRRVWGPKRPAWRELAVGFRRRRRTWNAAAIVTLATMIGLAVGWESYTRQSTRQRRQARLTYTDHVAQASLHWGAGDLVATHAELKRATEVEGGGGDLRESVWFALEKASRPLRAVREIQAHQGAIYAVTESPDGRFLATAGKDQVIRLWRLGTDSPPQELIGHTKGVSELAFSPDGTRLASVADDATFRLWSLPEGKEIALGSIICSTTVGTTIAFSPNDRHFAVEGESGAYVREIRGLAVAYSRDGRRIATGGDDRAIRLWDGRDGSFRNEFPNVAASTQTLVFTSDGRIHSGHQDGTLHTWEPDTLHSHSVRRPASGAIDHIALIDDSGDHMLVTGNEPSVWVWDLTDRSAAETVLDSEHGVRSAVISPDRTTIATIDKRGIVRLFTFKGLPVGVFQATQRKGTAVRFLSDGVTLVTAASDGKLAFWRWRDAVMFSPGGRSPQPATPQSGTVFLNEGVLTVSRRGKEPLKIDGVPPDLKIAWLGPQSLALFHAGKHSGLWDLETGHHLVKTPPGPQLHWYAGRADAPHGPLVWQEGENLIGLYDPTRGTRIGELPDLGSVWFRIGRLGQFLAVVGNAEVRVWDLATRTIRWRKSMPGSQIENLIASEDGRYAQVIESLEKNQLEITVWETTADRPILKLPPLSSRKPSFGLSFPVHQGDPFAVWTDVVSPRGMVVVPTILNVSTDAPKPGVVGTSPASVSPVPNSGQHDE